MSIAMYTDKEALDFLDIDMTALQKALTVHEAICDELTTILEQFDKSPDKAESKAFRYWENDARDAVQRASYSTSTLYCQMNENAVTVLNHLCEQVNGNSFFSEMGLQLSLELREGTLPTPKALHYSITVGDDVKDETISFKEETHIEYAGDSIKEDFTEAWVDALSSLVPAADKKAGYTDAWLEEDFLSGYFDVADMKQSVQTGQLTDKMTEAVHSTIKEYCTPQKETVNEERGD